MQGSDTNEARMRQEIVEVCRLMYQRNLIAASDGNVSVRWGERYLITTPTGLYKGFLRPEDLVVTDLDGQLAPEDVAPRNGYGPSAELRLHLEVYRQRPDVCAVVHAHPPITTALTVAGVSLAPCIVPETLVTLGSIVTTAYATPTSSQGPEVIRPYIRDHDALVLDRHGAVTVGDTVFSASGHCRWMKYGASALCATPLCGR
jgi:L-fuculose-phosphate aldolase